MGGVLGDRAEFGKNVPHQHHRQDQILVRNAQAGQVFDRDAENRIGQCSHANYHDHTGLVPDAVSGHRTGPLSPAGSGRAAGEPIQHHAGSPGHHQPAQPAECRGKGTAGGCDHRLDPQENVVVFHGLLLSFTLPARCP